MTTTVPPDADRAEPELPPLGEANASKVLAQVEAVPGLVQWIEGVITSAALADPSLECNSFTYELLGVEVIEAVAQLDDGVLAELILNSDASLSAVVAACESEESELAQEELEAARASVEWMSFRLTELEGEA